MRRDDEQLKSIVETSPIGVIIIDDDGVQRWVNRRAGVMLGATAAELTGKHPTIYRPRSGALRELEQLFKTQGWVRDFEFELRRVDTGAEVWVSCQIDPLIFEGVPARICWLTEITGYKRAERERLSAQARAEAAEARLRAIVEALPVGVIVFDAEKNLTFWNERYCEQTATTSDAYRRTKTHRDVCAYVYELFPNLRDQPFEDFLEFWETRMWGEGQGPMVLDFEEPKMTSLQFVSRLPDGGSILVVVDITEQKKAESEALRAQEEAEDANRAKSTFLAAMSHEIRTPMNGVLGMIEVLEQSALTDEQRTMTGTIRDSASTLLRIIDDVLDFSKIEAGHLELEAVPLAIRPMLESTLDSIAAAAEAKSLDLTLEIAPDVPDAMIGDPVRLRQIALNLLGNAIKFTEAGGVSITVTASPITELVSSSLLTISIVDSGIGIPEDAQQGLFTPFTQAESSTTRRFGGTGLGLSICRRLVDLMGGTIGVESTPGAGARFWFSIPMEISAVRSESVAPDLRGLEILLISPRERLTSMAARILESAGARVWRRDRLDHAEASDPKVDVVIMDDRAGSIAALERPAVLLTAAGRGATEHVNIPHVAINRPPRREALLRAVTRIAGRASGDVGRSGGTANVTELLDARGPEGDGARATGAPILVAEDNLTNRLVVERQLALLGHVSEIAEDGAEALALWREGGHALLLTDCHMPNLDGYDLARTIRREEDPARRLPIVALTANALAGEAERCFDAGMDDYMAKPVTLSELRRVLDRWIGTGRDGKDHGGPKPGSPGKAEPIDRDLLRDILGDDDPRMVDLVATAFLNSAEPIFTDLRRAIAARELSAFRPAAHKASGAAGSLAALPLRDVLRQMEAMAEAEDWAAINGLSGEMERRLGALIDHLQSTRAAITM
jgi:PAS domain S-box-containing protein